jgi:integrase
VKKGKTPVLLGDEARTLIDSIDVTTIIGLRDRALIALLIYSFARISAALQMNVDDYYPQGKRWWVRLHEKGGKQHEMPAHHSSCPLLSDHQSRQRIPPPPPASLRPPVSSIALLCRGEDRSPISSGFCHNMGFFPIIFAGGIDVRSLRIPGPDDPLAAGLSSGRRS